MEYHIVECYWPCIIEILRYFFILQCLTTSKMRKFQTLKLSQVHKAKTCWTENWWSSGIMSNLLGDFFYVLRVKKNFLNIFLNFVKKFAPQNIEKLPSKVAHNPTRQPVFSPASFCFVNLRQFYSLKFSHLWSCHSRMKNSLEFLWCRCNSIPLYSTQLTILSTLW